MSRIFNSTRCHINNGTIINLNLSKHVYSIACNSGESPNWKEFEKLRKELEVVKEKRTRAENEGVGLVKTLP